MAIRALNSVVVANYDTTSTATWSAGVGLQRSSTAGNVQIAQRAQGAGGGVGFTGGFVTN